MSSSESRATSFANGELIANRYRIVSLIGSGGMGEVYRADDQFLRETIAIKKLRSDLARNETVARLFQKEIQLARKVTHANICRVFEVGVHQSTSALDSKVLFFTMELLEGETLMSKIRREGKFSRETAYPIAAQMAEGLAAAHRAGVVHTDFKSGNVMLVPSPGSGERAVIMDFGLARRDPAMLPPEMTRTMVSPGSVAGTIGYMSPEQLSGGTITPASDIYSFGIVLYEMATGQLPFDDRHVINSAMQRASGNTVSVRSLVPDIDPRWEQAIARCLQKKPEDRFQSAADLADWFRQGAWWMPRLWTRREWTRASLAAGIPLVAGTGFWIWLTQPYQPQPAALDWYAKGVAALHSMTYEAARRAFEQAVTADPRFALAHASLARTYDEMDYTDRAREVMLRAVGIAQDTRLSGQDERKLRALQHVVSRDYDRAAPLFQELEDGAEGHDKAAAAVESGWVAQQREDTEGAAAAFERALSIDPRYAAAQLRLGFILGRRGGKDDEALEAFTEAESLYDALSDYEGVTETLLQRANLLSRRSRATEAMPFIERGLSVAQTVGNRYQEIRLLQLQGVATRNMGDTRRAGELAQNAADEAIAENMDNLATSALIDVGNSFVVGGDSPAAEPFFHRALELARRAKVRRSEARAQLSLATICEQDRRPEEAKQHVEAVLEFYRQAGYRRELVQARIILGGAFGQLAQYDQGVRILNEALPDAAQLQDRPLEALLRERLGSILQVRGNWPEALNEYERTVNLYGSSIQAGYVQVKSADLQSRLGRKQEAERSLTEAWQLQKKSQNSKLLSAIKAELAQVAYADGRLDQALSLTREGLSIVGAGEEQEQDLNLIHALILIRRGDVTGGAALSAKVIAKLEQAKLMGSAAAGRLLLAEAWVAVGNRVAALDLSGQSLKFFEPREIWESILRAHLVAARSAEGSPEADAHAGSARAALAQMKALWPAASLDGYRRRVNRQLFEVIGF